MASKTFQKNQKRKQASASRTKRGNVSVTSRSGRLRITVPAQHSPIDKQYHRALGRPDTSDNWAVAQEIADQINALILLKNYDPQRLDEYIFGKIAADEPTLTPNSLRSKKEARPDSLSKLWKRYVTYQRDIVKLAETTLEFTYKSVGLRIEKLTTQRLSDASVIAAELNKRYCERDSYIILKLISNCCDWAIQEELISKKPFKVLLRGRRQPKPEFNPDPFSNEEVERIMAAFAAHPTNSRYIPLVKFKFLTGCRPAEAIGLRWKHIDWVSGQIKFCQIIAYSSGKYVARDGTKTEPQRIFPISSEIRQLLEEIKPNQVNPDDFVFQEPDGNHVNYEKFYQAWCGRKKIITLNNGEQKEVWTGIVSGLAQKSWEEGGISKYAPPYNTRHTYITAAVTQIKVEADAGSTNFTRAIATLADRVGNSPQVIFDHYLGRLQDDSFLHVSYNTSKSFSASHPQNPLPENGKADQQLPIDPPSAIEALQQDNETLKQENHALRQNLAQIQLQLQKAPQPPVLPEEQTELNPDTESALIDLASLITMDDELF